MQDVSISANQGSQAFGQDAGGGVLLGSMVKATVVQKLDENLYLLQVGRHTLEAQVMAELEPGVEYRFTVEKGGNPPELALIDQNATRVDGLTAEEQRWITRLASTLGQEPQQLDLKSLLTFLRSVGMDINMSTDAVAQKLQPVLEALLSMDGAPPAIRQLMGQTLVFTMHLNPSEMGEGWIEKAIQLSGQLPKWSEADSDFLLQLKSLVESLSKTQQNDLKSHLMGTSKSNSALEVLKTAISQTLGDAKPPESMDQTLKNILNDPIKRLFLASNTSEFNGNKSLGSLQRGEAIAAFQRQAPGLMTSDISNLLEQFTALGGKLEKLPVGDVVSAQLSWKGGSPSAMQVHRTGSLLYLSQEHDVSQRQFSRSDLITKAPAEQLPVVIDPTMVSDPSSSSLSMNRMEEFSQQSSLPNNFHVERLLQNWHQSGGALSELRGHLTEINAWNSFIESFPELRAALAEHLMGSQAITQENPTQGPRVLSVLPQTQQVLTESLQTSSHQHIPQKELSQAMQALQEVAGEGKIPTKTQVAVTSWMLGKGIEVTPNTLQSLLQFHSGHQEVQGLYKDLQQLQTYLKGENPELAKLAQSGIAELQGKDGESIKDTLSFYQKGNGSQLNKWLNQVRAHLSQMPQPKVEWMQLAQSLQGRLTVQEDFLAGLKQYNIQAQRQDTPQLYEVPVSFGEETQHALLKVFKRDQGQGSDAKKNYKVVIELDLEGLGKVRSEVSLIDQHLQLDFLSPNSESLTALKASAGTLQDRLSDHQLKANLGFKQKDVQDNLLITEQASHAAPKESSGINITA